MLPKMYNLSKICSMCLSNTTFLYKSNMVDRQDKIKLIDKLNFIVFEKNCAQENIARKICDDCKHMIRTGYRFKKMCQKNYKTLQEYVENKNMDKNSVDRSLEVKSIRKNDEKHYRNYDKDRRKSNSASTSSSTSEKRNTDVRNRSTDSRSAENKENTKETAKPVEHKKSNSNEQENKSKDSSKRDKTPERRKSKCNSVAQIEQNKTNEQEHNSKDSSKRDKTPERRKSKSYSVAQIERNKTNEQEHNSKDSSKRDKTPERRKSIYNSSVGKQKDSNLKDKDQFRDSRKSCSDSKSENHRKTSSVSSPEFVIKPPKEKSNEISDRHNSEPSMSFNKKYYGFTSTEIQSAHEYLFNIKILLKFVTLSNAVETQNVTEGINKRKQDLNKRVYKYDISKYHTLLNANPSPCDSLKNKPKNDEKDYCKQNKRKIKSPNNANKKNKESATISSLDSNNKIELNNDVNDYCKQYKRKIESANNANQNIKESATISSLDSNNKIELNNDVNDYCKQYKRKIESANNANKKIKESATISSVDSNNKTELNNNVNDTDSVVIGELSSSEDDVTEQNSDPITSLPSEEITREDHIRKTYPGPDPNLIQFGTLINPYIPNAIESTEELSKIISNPSAVETKTLTVPVLPTESLRPENLGNSFQQFNKAMNEVRNIINKDRLFECQFCDRTFTRKQFLLLHYIVHCEKVGSVYKCPVCKKTFEDETSMKNHLFTHNDTPVPQCYICNRAFTREYALALHILASHKGIRAFKCHICDKSFARHSTLKSHLKRHSAYKDYRCNVCGTFLASKCGLKRHMAIHTGHKPYGCKLCDKAYVYRCQLTDHIVRQHYNKDIKAKKLQ